MLVGLLTWAVDMMDDERKMGITKAKRRDVLVVGSNQKNAVDVLEDDVRMDQTQ